LIPYQAVIDPVELGRYFAQPRWAEDSLQHWHLGPSLTTRFDPESVCLESIARRVKEAMSSGNATPVNWAISPIQAGACMNKRSCNAWALRRSESATAEERSFGGGAGRVGGGSFKSVVS